MMANLALSAKV